jgi:hypothetical protein
MLDWLAAQADMEVEDVLPVKDFCPLLSNLTTRPEELHKFSRNVAAGSADRLIFVVAVDGYLLALGVGLEDFVVDLKPQFDGQTLERRVVNFDRV